jgi:hypothetical protein
MYPTWDDFTDKNLCASGSINVGADIVVCDLESEIVLPHLMYH